jgi:DNA-directed RNA polymerase specialized sigma24 family protein
MHDNKQARRLDRIPNRQPFQLYDQNLKCFPTVMSGPPDEINADELLRHFVLERSQSDYERLYASLFPRLLAALKSGFGSLPEACHQDILQEVFLKLHAHPEDVWNPKSGKPSHAFSILCSHAANRARDIIREANRANEVGLDEAGEKDIATCPPGVLPSHTPSVDEMEKVIIDVGLNDPLLADLKKPEMWKDGKAKPDYEKLAERHKITVANMQQRVSRYRKQVLKKFGSKSVFLSIATNTFCWVKQNFPHILAWSFIFAGVLTIFFLIKQITPRSNAFFVSQNLSTGKNSYSETKRASKGPNQNLDALNPEIKTNKLLSPFALDPLGKYIGTISNQMTMRVRARFEGIPDKVEVFCADTSKTNQIWTLLNKDSVRSELWGLDSSAGYYPMFLHSSNDCAILIDINSHPDDQDMLDCAKYVQSLLSGY